MRRDIRKYVFHLCWSPESVPADVVSNSNSYAGPKLMELVPKMAFVLIYNSGHRLNMLEEQGFCLTRFNAKSYQ